MTSRKFFAYGLMGLASTIVAGILFAILFFIVDNGYENLSLSYVFSSSEIESGNVVVEQFSPGDIKYEIGASSVTISEFNHKLNYESDLDLSSAGEIEIKRINDIPISYMEDDEYINEQLTTGENVDLKVTVVTSGLLSMIIATLMTIVISLLIALPFSIGTAIYLIEYPVNSKLYEITNFSINSLTAIPSIIFGLFGSLFFKVVLGLPTSILTGSLTLAIMLLPILIRSTQEALLSVDKSLRQASRGLGAGEVQTIFNVVLPSAIPGIIVGIILAIGRVIGESAILVFTAGTVDKLTLSPLESSSTLTVKAYILAQEYGDISHASTIAIIIVLIIVLLNVTARNIGKKFELGV